MILTKLQSRFDEIADNLAEKLDPVVEEAAQMVADQAKDTTPPQEQTGRLKQSIRVIRYDTCRYNVVADAVAPQATNPLPYGIMLEFGTEAGGKGGGGIEPTFFMGNATAAVYDEAVELITRKLGEL